MSTKEKKWRAFGANCGFYEGKYHGLDFFLGFLGVTLNGASGRIYEPNYKIKAFK